MQQYPLIPFADLERCTYLARIPALEVTQGDDDPLAVRQLLDCPFDYRANLGREQGVLWPLRGIGNPVEREPGMVTGKEARRVDARLRCRGVGGRERRERDQAAVALQPC